MVRGVTSLGLSKIEKELGTVPWVRSEVERAQRRFSQFHDAMAADLSFGLDLQHYNNDNDPTERSINRIKPRDPGQFRIHRYKTALLLKRFPVHIETRPDSPDDTPQDLENTRRRIEHVLYDDDSGYMRERRAMVQGGLGARAWCIGMDVDPEMGITFEAFDGRNLLWADGYRHPHMKRNPRIFKIWRAPVDQIRAARGWDVPANLLPDDYAQMATSASSNPFDSQSKPTLNLEDENGLVTLVAMYERYCHVNAKYESQYTELDPAMRYMQCERCKSKSAPQAETMMPLPEFQLGGCPECGGDLQRIDGMSQMVDKSKYPNGKRLVICAPFSNAPDPFVEGGWPFDYPCFPVAFFQPYVMPHKPIGMSDSYILKTPTIAKNGLSRLGYETMLKSKPRHLLYGEVTNAQNMPYMFTEADGDVMKGYMPNAVQIIQGQGINSGLLQMIQWFDAQTSKNESTSEVALSPSQIKEAKVGVVEQQTETGNVVLDDHGALLYEAETPLVRCLEQVLAEMPSAFAPHQTANGDWEFPRVGGPSMARGRVSVSAGYAMDRLDTDDIQAFQQLASMPPEFRRAYAETAQINGTVLARIEQAQAAMDERMAQMQQMKSGAPQGGPPPQAVPAGAQSGV